MNDPLFVNVKVRCALFVCACAVFAAGCVQKDRYAVPQDGKLTVTAINFPLYDFARAIAGDYMHVSMLLPPGAESHSFEPTPKDIISLRHSDIILYVGGESEAWVSRVIETLDADHTAVLTLMDTVDAVEEEVVEGMEDDEDEDGGGHEYDEHIWTAPANAKRIALAINHVFSEKDPDHAAVYQKNTEALIAGFDELDREFRGIVDNAKRNVIVFADRFPFRYFTEAYGLSYRAAFPGCSTETEPSALTVKYLIDMVQAEKIPVVFFLELSNEKMADTISEATGAKKLLLHSGHNVSKKDFDRGVTYLELQKENVSHLKEALQ